MNEPVKVSVEHTIPQSCLIIDYLQSITGLSKRKLKDAMRLGAVWLQKPKGKMNRVRKANLKAEQGDHIALYYDEKILTQVPPKPECLWSCDDYAVWFKPAGVLSQGSKFGDHMALPRMIQLTDQFRKEVFVVHRLDREAYGLILFARTKAAASRLSAMFQQQQIDKLYKVTVKGQTPESGVINSEFDGKPALTAYEIVAYDPEHDQSQLIVRIKTGRKHQIRRHFAQLGYPVMGDPEYGRGNHSDQGLALCAQRLTFRCPMTQEHRDFDLDELMRA